jgi:hypothetical protein
MSISAYQLGVATQHVAVTPDDTTNIVTSPRRLFIGSGGDINVTDQEGVSLIYKNVPSGYALDIVVKRVNATDTTAGDIIGQL